MDDFHPDLYATVEQSMAYLGKSRATIMRHIASGELPSERVRQRGKRVIRGIRWEHLAKSQDGAPSGLVIVARVTRANIHVVGLYRHLITARRLLRGQETPGRLLYYPCDFDQQVDAKAWNELFEYKEEWD